MPSVLSIVIHALPRATPLRLAVLAVAAWLGSRWIARQRTTRGMPPFVPFAALSLREVLLYPLFGHIFMITDPKRFDRVVQQYGADGVISFWAFNRPALWWTNSQLTKEVFGMDGAQQPEIAKLTATHPTNDLKDTFKLLWTAPASSELWKRHRKYLVQHLLSGTILREGVDFLRAEVRLLMLRLASKRGTPYNPRYALKNVPTNYLNRLVIGARQDSEDDGTARTDTQFHGILERVMKLYFTTSIGSVLPALYPFDPIVKEGLQQWKKFQKFCDRLLEDERKGVLPNAPLTHDMNERLRSGDMSPTDVYGLFSVIYNGGTHTVSNSLIYFVQLMADNPAVQKQLQDEIDAIVPADQFVDVGHVEKMTLLWCAIKESARLRPLFKVTTSRATVAPLKWRDFELPTGVLLLVRGESFTVDGGAEFDLRRHSHNPRLDLTGKTDAVLPLFGGGARVCPGAALAEKELGLVLANILKCFTIEPTTKPACAEPPLAPGAQLDPVHVPLKFVPRPGIVVAELSGLAE